MLARFAASPFVRLPLVIAMTLALQTSVATDVRPLGIAPDLMLLLVVAGGLVGGSQRGAVAGFVIGLAFDLVLQTPFGLSALVGALTAYALGFLRLGVERSGWWIRIVAVFVASFGAVLAWALLGSLFGLTRIVNPRLVEVALVVATVNAVLAPIGLAVMGWALVVPAGRSATRA